MDNLKLIDYCIGHPEGFLDTNYMFPEKHKDLDLYVEKGKEVKNKLIAIKQIQNKKNSDQIIDQIFDDLQKILKKYANYSEFGCFINACDSKIEEVCKDLNLLKLITDLYLEKRDINDITPSEWVQAIIDKGSSRRKGNAGENKLAQILTKRGFIKAQDINEFNKKPKAFSFFSKSKNGNFSIKNIKTNLGVKLGVKNQGKCLDLVIKKNSDIYFLEAKHMSTSGGGQNKQMVEIIDLIRTCPPKEEYHFVAFLDGIYFNAIFEPEKTIKDKKQKNKTYKQQRDIMNSLKRNKTNYFINTAGFTKLFS